MSGYHNFEASRFRLQIKLGQVMQDVDRNAAEFNHFSFRQPSRPCSFVDVAAHCCHWRNCGKFVEDVGCSHVSRVNDVLRSTECRERFRTKQAVRIGDDADKDRRPQFPELCHSESARSVVIPSQPVSFVIPSEARNLLS